VAGLFVFADALFDELAGVDDGAVVFAAEGVADVVQRGFREFAGEVHGDLAREGDIGRAALARHVGEADVVVLGDLALDLVDGDGFAGLLLEDVAEEVLDDVLGDFAVAEGLVGGDAHEGAFQAADVVADAVGEEFDDPGLERDVEALRLLLENGDTSFHVGRLELAGHAPLEAGDEALLELLDLAGGTVAGQDNLLVTVVQGIEGVEKLFLGTLLAREELDVVDHQHIGLAVFLAEFHESTVLDGIDELIGELLAGEIDDLGRLLVLEDVVTDSLQEVGLAQAAAAVDEEGVVGLRGGLRHGHGRTVRKLVVRTNDEGFEGVAGV